MSASSSTTNTVELLRASGMLLSEWGQRDAHRRSLCRGAIPQDLSVVRLNDRATNRKPDSKSVVLGRRKRREQEIGVKAQSRPKVVHANEDRSVRDKGLNLNAALVAR